MPGKNVLEISQDCISFTYHLMIFQKIKERFELKSTRDKINILGSAHASGLTVQLTNLKTHKIDNSTLKLFNMLQAIRSDQACLFFKKTCLSFNRFSLQMCSWQKKEF